MQKIYTDLSLDFQSGKSLVAVRATQGDKSGGRILRLALYNNGQRVTLNSETDTVTLLASVGDVITEAGQACTIVDNTVRVDILDGLTQLDGIEHCTVRCESANGRVHTALFDIIVEKSPISPDMPEIIATADLVDRVDAIETTSHDFVKNYLISSFQSVHPEYTYVSRGNTAVLGSAGSHYCLVPKSVFDPDIDGVMIWTNLYLLETYLYEFDTTTDPDNVIIEFVQSADYFIDANDNKVDVLIYEKPPDGATAVGDEGLMTPYRYFITPIYFNGSGLTSYEICTCFKLTRQISRGNAFFGAQSNYYVAPSCEMTTSGLWHAFAYSGDSWAYQDTIAWVDAPILFDGTMQWIKVAWNASEQKQKMFYSTDGVNYELLSEFATPATAYTPSGTGERLIFGSVASNSYHDFEDGNDINIFNSYIKMNGTLVFGREVTA